MSIPAYNFSVPAAEDTSVSRTVFLNGVAVDLSIAPVVMIFNDPSALGNTVSSIQAVISGTDNNVATFTFDSSELTEGDELIYRIEFQKTGDTDEISFGTVYVTDDDRPYNSKIKYIHDIVNFYTDKGMTGAFVPDDIDNAIHSVQLNLFRDLVRQYAETEQMSAILRNFLDTAKVPLVNGIGTLPDRMHTQEEVVTDSEVEVDVIEKQDWAKRVKHPIKGPHEDYPICQLGPTFIDVRPSTISSVTISYLRIPGKPKFATEIQSGRLVFDNSESIDIEWPESMLDYISDLVLSKLGINLKDADIYQMSSVENSIKVK